MKEILNTLYEIEVTANQIISSIDTEKKKLRSKYTDLFEVYKQELDKEIEQKLNETKNCLNAQFEQQQKSLISTYQSSVQKMEQSVVEQKQQYTHEIIASILSTY